MPPMVPGYASLMPHLAHRQAEVGSDCRIAVEQLAPVSSLLLVTLAGTRHWIVLRSWHPVCPRSGPAPHADWQSSAPPGRRQEGQPRGALSLPKRLNFLRFLVGVLWRGRCPIGIQGGVSSNCRAQESFAPRGGERPFRISTSRVSGPIGTRSSRMRSSSWRTLAAPITSP